MTILGTQVLVDLFDCQPDVLNDPQAIETIMLEAARRCGASVVNQCFHRFNPVGVSGVLIIAESHLTIHTWPEHGYAAVDLFTCGKVLQPQEGIRYLQEALGASHHQVSTLARGR